MAFRQCLLIILVALISGMVKMTEEIPLSISKEKLAYQFLTSPHPIQNYATGTHSFSSKQPPTQMVCQKSGLQSHPFPNATNKYILCVKYLKLGRWVFYVYECPNGSRFDKEKKICIPSYPTTTEDPCMSREERSGNEDESEEIICS